MEMYLDGQEVPQDKIRAAIRKATIANEMVPVTCGTSYKNKGVQKMLDAIVDYMPSPTDVPAIKGVNPSTEEEEERPSSDNEPFSALAFKIATDPYVGRLSFIRVYSGTLNTGTQVLNSTKKQKERIGRILQMHANHREDIETVYAGDIAAVIGLKTPPPAIPSATKSTPSFWSPWSSPNLLSGWPLSLKPRPARRR